MSFFYTKNGDFMKVKVFDEAHEKDLEQSLNEFLSEVEEVFDIKYSISVAVSEEQIYCFSALVMYR